MTNRGGVLVLWTGYRAGPWVVRSLRRAGHRVIAAHPRGAPDGRTVATVRPIRYPPPATEPDAFLGWLARTCRELRPMAVMTLDEDLVSLLARSAPDVGEAVLIGPDARRFEALCDKTALDATARAAGVGRPAAVVVHGGEPEGPWPPLPSVVKPRASADVPVELNRVAVVATAAERDEHVRRLAAAGVDAVVEERIHGAHWTRLRERPALRAGRDLPRPRREPSSSGPGGARHPRRLRPAPARARGGDGRPGARRA